MAFDIYAVEKWFVDRGHPVPIIHLDQTAATASDAAAALHCPVSQIAKSLIFYNPQTAAPFLIIVSGGNRVDKEKVGEYLGQKIKTASPEFVLEATGFPAGSVPPVSLKHPVRTLFDQNLLNFEQIYAAAGSPRAVFSVNPKKLIELTKAEII